MNDEIGKCGRAADEQGERRRQTEEGVKCISKKTQFIKDSNLHLAKVDCQIYCLIACYRNEGGEEECGKKGGSLR